MEDHEVYTEDVEFLETLKRGNKIKEEEKLGTFEITK